MFPADSSSAIPATETASVPGAEQVGNPITPRRIGKKRRIPRIKKWSPVIVTWADAVTYRDESHSDDNFNLAVRRSIGHFIKRTKEAISIAMEDDREHKDAESDCQTVTAIPIGMIRKIVVLVPKD